MSLMKWFNNSKENILLSVINELKEDKKVLLHQVEIKDKIISDLLACGFGKESKKTIDNTSLSPLEQKVFEFVNSNSSMSHDKQAKKLKLTPGSLRVYKHKIRKKGHNI